MSSIMSIRAIRTALMGAVFLVAMGGWLAAQESVPPAPAQEPAQEKEKSVTTLPNLSEKNDWPEPVADRAKHGFLLIDNFEYQPTSGPDALRWDIFGWRGGDVHRLWFKSEGRKSTSPSQGSEYEVQALYGKLIAPFFDLQMGLRFDQRLRRGFNPARFYAVLGLQGLSPYRFEIEPTLFLSNKGQVSGRLTATYDILLTQRLIVQPRLETNVAVQRDEEIGIGAGLNDVEVGFRLRYEIRREFSPYIGLTYKESVGATHRLTVLEGGDSAHFSVAAGVRMWF